MTAPGNARRMGEWVAMIACAVRGHELLEQREERELPGRRQRRLGLVEEVGPVGDEPLAEEAQEALAVRLGVEALAVAPPQLAELAQERGPGEVVGEAGAILVLLVDGRQLRLELRAHRRQALRVAEEVLGAEVEAAMRPAWPSEA